MPPTKPTALKRAAAAQGRLNTAEAKATDAASERDQWVFIAQQAGASYAEIQEATGLSTARVTQVLRKVRQTKIEALQNPTTTD